jgi:anti-sigma B factor antagonist
MALLDVYEEEDVVIVAFKQAKILDETMIRQIGQEFRDLPKKAAAGKKLVLNLGKVEFMSSSLISQIITLNVRCKQDKVRLELCGIQPAVREAFTLTRLDKILRIRWDEE